LYVIATGPLDRAAAARPAGEEPALALGPTLERGALIEAVLERNPTLEAARHAWRAALQRVPQATSLDDPTLSYSVGPLSIASDARFGQVVRLAQRLPAAGTLRLRGEVARGEAAVAHHELGAARLAVAHMAALLFDDYYYLHRAIEINEEHVSLLEDFKRIATARYAAGTAAQQDPLQAEVEVAHLLHRRVVLESARQVSVAQINALLHRRPEQPLPPPPPALAHPGPEPPTATALQELAVQARPELRAARAEIHAREAGVELREKRFRPDFEVMSSFNSMWGTAEHRWMVGVGVRLPLRRGRIRAGVAEAEARLAQARSQRARVEDDVRSEVHQAYARLDEARHVVRLHLDRLLPAARDQVQAALAGFRSGRNSFLALIEAERNQRTSRLSLEAALAGHGRASADLDRALGRIPGSPGGPGAPVEAPPPVAAGTKEMER
jgi:outer membrane protein TolC